MVTSNPGYQAPGCTLAGNLNEAIRLASGAPEVMVMGGEQLYTEALPHADRIYLTRVETDATGDRYFPEYDPEAWREISRVCHDADADNPFRYCFVTLERFRSTPSSAPEGAGRP